MQSGTGFTRLTADASVNQNSTLFFGLIIEASADGGIVNVYEGNDADTGRLFASFKGLQNDRRLQGLHEPVFFDRGLYVDIGANVTAVTIMWLPG